MTRRALLRLLSLLPFAPLFRLAPAKAVYVKEYGSCIVGRDGRAHWEYYDGEVSK